MKTILGILLLLMISMNAHAEKGYLYLGLGLGNNTNLTGSSVPWEDQGEIGSVLTLGYRERLNNYKWFSGLSDRWYGSAQWLHISHPFIGPPFNNRDESSVDHLGVYIEYRFL